MIMPKNAKVSGEKVKDLYDQEITALSQKIGLIKSSLADLPQKVKDSAGYTRLNDFLGKCEDLVKKFPSSKDRLHEVNNREKVGELLDSLCGKEGLQKTLYEFNVSTGFKYASNNGVKSIFEVCRSLDRTKTKLSDIALDEYNLSIVKRVRNIDDLEGRVKTYNYTKMGNAAQAPADPAEKEKWEIGNHTLLESVLKMQKPALESAFDLYHNEAMESVCEAPKANEKFDAIKARLDLFAAHIADNQGSHKNSGEFKDVLTALDNAQKSENMKDLKANLGKLMEMADTYLEKKGSRKWGSSLRHVRMGLVGDIREYCSSTLPTMSKKAYEMSPKAQAIDAFMGDLPEDPLEATEKLAQKMEDPSFVQEYGGEEDKVELFKDGKPQGLVDVEESAVSLGDDDAVSEYSNDISLDSSYERMSF